MSSLQSVLLSWKVRIFSQMPLQDIPSTQGYHEELQYGQPDSEISTDFQFFTESYEIIVGRLVVYLKLHDFLFGRR
jgi:hypothetical protein